MPAKNTKKAVEGVNSKLQLVMKSGKVNIGYKSTIKCTRNGVSKLILISSNCPALQKSVLEYYAMLSKTNIHYFTGSNRELGTACGKLFGVSCMSILDAGDSDILKSVNEQ